MGYGRNFDWRSRAASWDSATSNYRSVLRANWRNEHLELSLQIDQLHRDQEIEDFAAGRLSNVQRIRIRKEFAQRNPGIASQIPELRRYAAVMRNREKSRRQRLADPDRAKSRVKNWKQSNRDRLLEYDHRRRARMGGPVSLEVLEFYKQVRHAETVMCHICKEPISKPERSIDHVVPLARGGKHEIGNLAPAHMLCNATKRDRLMSEFVFAA